MSISSYSYFLLSVDSYISRSNLPEKETLFHLINSTDRTRMLSHTITHRMSHCRMDGSHLAATFHWLESQLLWDPRTHQDLKLSLNDFIKVKHNRSREQEEEEEEVSLRKQQTYSLHFLCNASTEETCQRSAASLSHTLLIIAGDVFKAEAEMPKTLKREKIQQVHTVVTQPSNKWFTSLTDKCSMLRLSVQTFISVPHKSLSTCCWAAAGVV